MWRYVLGDDCEPTRKLLVKIDEMQEWCEPNNPSGPCIGPRRTPTPDDLKPFMRPPWDNMRHRVETAGVGHNSVCSGVEEHGNCAVITLGTVIPSLSAMDKLRDVKVETLGELISLLIAKDVPTAQIRNWAAQRNTHGPDYLLKFSSNHSPSSQDFIPIISLWVDRCDFAFRQLQLSGCKNIRFPIPRDNKNYPFQKQIENAIEEVKARRVLGLAKVSKNPFILYADSGGKVMEGKLETEIISERSCTALSKEVEETYFGSEVREILIFMGTDDINDNVPIEISKIAIQKITAHMAKFSHKTLFIPPPFIADKPGHHEKFLEMLEGIVPKEGKISLALTRGYRSIVEITRYGDKEENRNVDAKGQLKSGGAKMILKFLRAVFGMETPISESKDRVETAGVGHNSVCSGVEEHGNCAVITLGTVIPSLSAMDKLRDVKVETLGELISLLIAKDVPTAQIRNWAAQRNTHGPDYLLKFSSNHSPSSQDFIPIISLWVDRCDFAFRQLQLSGCKNIRFPIPRDNKNYPFQKQIENAIEEVKARRVLGLAKVSKNPFILYADSGGKVMEGKLETEIISERSCTALSKEVEETYFGSEVREILIFMGTDDINDNVPIEISKIAIQKITAHMAKFSHKTLFIPPPFIADKPGHHEKFLEMLEGIVPKEGKISLALTRGYRSIVEITRYGDKEENRNVDAKGQLKQYSTKKLSAGGKADVGAFAEAKSDFQAKPVSSLRGKKSGATSPSIALSSSCETAKMMMELRGVRASLKLN
ncbi:hypothetical protein GPALN_012054 [Globodera pallida]|nr:hypothetical protein GPALN_012054 [Globodera pallida]